MMHVHELMSEVSRDAARHPSAWSSIRCAHLFEPITAQLRPESSLEEVLAEHRACGTRGVLVFDAADPIGVLSLEYLLASTFPSGRPFPGVPAKPPHRAASREMPDSLQALSLRGAVTFGRIAGSCRQGHHTPRSARQNQKPSQRVSCLRH